MNFFTLFENTAMANSTEAAILDEQGTLTYQELLLVAQAYMDFFTAQGLQPGYLLGIKAKNSRTFIAAMLGGIGCGALVLPISHQLKRAEIETIINETNLNALWDDGSGTALNDLTLDSHAVNEITFNFGWLQREAQPQLWQHFDPAFMRFTSGTTGRSKGVLVSHHSLAERTAAAAQALRLEEGQRVAWVLPMAYHFLVSILTYLRTGACIVICKDMLAQHIIESINQAQASLLYAAPMHFKMLATNKSDTKMPSLKWAISTSAAIPPSVAETFSKRYGVPLTQAYGIIEIGLPIINRTLGAELADSVGQAVEGFDVAILDEQHQAVNTGIEGALAMRGPGMFDAYLTPFQLRDDVMEQGWFMTGDTALKDEQGHIHVLGRTKSMINVAGNKSFPEEIEAVLLRIPNIKAARVWGEPHPLTGEIVCAEVCFESPQDLDVNAIMRFCRERLSMYKVPQKIRLADKIEQTGSGKIVRN